MALTLRLVTPQGEETTRSVEGDEILIGRAPECGIVLPDASISRRHARLFARDGRWFVEDLGSRNGTAVNGVRILREVRLEAGTSIVLGGSRIEVLAVPATPWEREIEDPSSGKLTRLVSARSLLDVSMELSVPGKEPGGAACRRLAERFELLTDVHAALDRSGSLDELFGLILDRVFVHLEPEQAAIYLSVPEGGHRCAASRSVDGEAGAVLHSRSLLAEVAGRGMSALVLDAQTDSRFSEAQSLVTSGVRSLAAAPLLDPEEGPLGMIVIGSLLHRRRFEEGDLEVLTALASVAAMRIRNLRLAEEAAERRRLEEEIALARRIQEALLPDALPEVAGWSLWGRTVPSRGVSGDMFTVVEREDGRLVVLVADVSGKGIGAAFLTASLEALTALPIREGSAPGRVLRSAGHLLHQRTPPEKFATAFLAVLDPPSGALTWSNAGHLPAFVVSPDGSCRMLAATGKPLGLFPDEEYEEREDGISRGEMLVVYTDGLTEAARNGEEFGVERLAAACSEAAGEPPSVLADRIGRTLEEFAGGGVFADDRTLVILKRDR